MKRGRKRKGEWIECEVCEKKKYYQQSRVKRNKHFYCSVKCQQSVKRNKMEVICAYCGEKFLKRPSAVKKSKSGLFFCCRKHKDMAQRLDVGVLEISHYKNGLYVYRKRAIEYYGAVCANEECSFSKKVELLEVHHIDENRENNEMSNLIVLCVRCHAAITRGIACIIDRKFVWI